MLKLLPLASHYALPAISNFHVGAIAQGASGALYMGSNLEIANESLANSIHAEQSAVNNALLHKESGINHIAITAPPCGHCRQFLNEIKNAGQIGMFVLDHEPTQLTHLLPHSFGPIDLGNTSPLFAQSRINNNQFTQFGLNLEGVQSYSPYTHSPSAVLLKAPQGINIVGVYIESAAYNPSLSPLLSALDRLRYQESDFSCIKEAILFEKIDAKISQRTHVESLLGIIAPEANFTMKVSSFK